MSKPKKKAKKRAKKKVAKKRAKKKVAKKPAPKKFRWVQDQTNVYVAEGYFKHNGQEGELVVYKSPKGWDAVFEPLATGVPPVTLGSKKSLGAAKTLAQNAIGRKKNPDMDERKIEEGKAALRHDYHESMRSSAREILQEAQDSGDYDDFDDAEDAISDRIREEADSSYWVIYTARALDTLVASDNWLAIQDHGMNYASDDFTEAITQAAYWAVYADISQYVQSYADEYWTDKDDNPGRKRNRSHRGRNPHPATAPVKANKAKLLR